MSPRGLFITFEGSEGCGKSTQIRLLTDALQRRQQRVVVVREPGGTPIGEQIRHTLQYSRESHAMTPETELLLFTASRAQLVRETILPALESGAIVISDRFMDSTTVYQGVARRLDPSAVDYINRFAVGSCLPHATFLLDMDAAQAMQRIASRPAPKGGHDRMEQQPLEFFESVRQGYLTLARSRPERFHILDATLPEQEIHAAILCILEEKIHGLSAR